MPKPPAQGTWTAGAGVAFKNLKNLPGPNAVDPAFPLAKTSSFS